jgi:hypothetical protein
MVANTNKTNNTNDERDESVAKKQYQSPVLTVHGAVAQLTLGGSGKIAELGNGNNTMRHP